MGVRFANNLRSERLRRMSLVVSDRGKEMLILK